MTSERRLVRGIGPWSLVAGVAATGISFAVRGAEGAASAAIALALVLANALAAAAISAASSKLSPTAPAMISLPSFTLRMGALFAVLSVLKGVTFIDQPTFALTFGLAVTAVVVLEARNWKRTPWLALTLDGAQTRREEKTS